LFSIFHVLIGDVLYDGSLYLQFCLFNMKPLLVQCVTLATEPSISLIILYCNEIWTGLCSLCEKWKAMCL